MMFDVYILADHTMLVMIETEVLVRLRNLSDRVLAVVPAMPEINQMKVYLEDADAAEKRGYFLPDEDDRVRGIYMRYLSVRLSLLEVVGEIKTLVKKEQLIQKYEYAFFAIGYSASVILIRTAKFIVKLSASRPVVRRKLDEAAPLYGLDRASFCAIYSNLTSPRRMWRFYEATKFFEEHQADIFSIDVEGLDDILELLKKESEFIELSKSAYLKRRLRYRKHSFRRRNSSGYRRVMFHLFRFSGCLISEMRQPFIKRLVHGSRKKRISEAVLNELQGMLLPGDVIVTRHDDALSNLFLPGFWPHAALYIGTRDQREALGCLEDCGPQAFSIIESKKDGVKYRELRETLKVDAFVILRSNFISSDLGKVISLAMGHEGKLYDFLFDFRQSDRLACTELVYRSYHGVRGLQLELEECAGRLCLSAESLMNQLLSRGQFHVAALYGLKGRKILKGELANRVLRGSYEMNVDLKS